MRWEVIPDGIAGRYCVARDRHLELAAWLTRLRGKRGPVSREYVNVLRHQDIEKYIDMAPTIEEYMRRERNITEFITNIEIDNIQLAADISGIMLTRYFSWFLLVMLGWGIAAMVPAWLLGPSLGMTIWQLIMLGLLAVAGVRFVWKKPADLPELILKKESAS